MENLHAHDFQYSAYLYNDLLALTPVVPRPAHRRQRSYRRPTHSGHNSTVFARWLLISPLPIHTSHLHAPSRQSFIAYSEFRRTSRRLPHITETRTCFA